MPVNPMKGKVDFLEIKKAHRFDRYGMKGMKLLTVATSLCHTPSLNVG